MLHVAIPVMDEMELLPRLVTCISQQVYPDFHLYVCVNQPDEWWNLSSRKHICQNNITTLEYLNRSGIQNLTMIDRCSPGHGWKGPRHGVGWARKTTMDTINRIASKDDIIVSLDADTTFTGNYFQSIAANFKSNPDAVAMAVPYFHKPTADPDAYRAILRYEIYMRYYSVNLWRIQSPYTFTALGSAMACPVWAYRAIGGLTPKMSGEDFYFLQKLRKYGRMLFHNPEKVYPEARFSDRVYFGTGPAMIRGQTGDWSSYPIYSHKFFDEIREIYFLFPSLYEESITSDVMRLLCNQLKEEDPWTSLRQNARDRNQFIRACHEKLDGLRILQYLKERNRREPEEDGTSLKEFLICFYDPDEILVMIKDLERQPLKDLSVEKLERIRMFLVRKEEQYQVSSVLS